MIAFGRLGEVTALWHPVLEDNISTLYRDHARGRHNPNNWEEVTINGCPFDGHAGSFFRGSGQVGASAFTIVSQPRTSADDLGDGKGPHERLY